MAGTELLRIEADGRQRPQGRRAGATGRPDRLVYIETYGCQMNLSDSELILGVLEEAGYRRASCLEEADVILLNTCAVREHAEDRVIGRLHQLSRLRALRPDMVLGMCGCMAKHLADTLPDRMPYVDLVVGPDSYRRLPELIQGTADGALLDVRLDRDEHYAGLRPVREEGTNAWVSIMRGCDKFCSFCIVPYVRGRERSVDAEEVLRQVEAAASEGFQEITLLGQTVNSYRDGRHDFSDLLRMTARVAGIRRIRFTSPHPSDFSGKLIETMAGEDKVCNYIHLPAQSGSDRVLAAMKRTYTSDAYLTLVDRLRRAMPDLCISTDIITGFPGEAACDFEATLDLMRAVRFDSAFMFKYSPREGTAAYREMPDTVTEEEKGRRLNAVIALQNEISEAINRGYVGRTLEVLVDGDARRGGGQAVGKTRGFKKVVFPKAGACPNTFVHVKVAHATSHTLMGEVVEAEGEGQRCS